MRAWSVAACLLTVACSGSTEPSGSLGGRWVGTYRIQRCAVTGYPECTFDPGEPVDLELQLTQSGSDVSGSFDSSSGPHVPVTGTVQAGVLVLEGRALQMPVTRLSNIVVTISRWTTANRDGRTLQGTFHMRVETTWGPGAAPYYPVGDTWTLDRDATVTLTKR